MLVGCERSRVVASAFERLGCYAMSCDLQRATRSGNHHQGDILEYLAGNHSQWDIFIYHPPCTYLARAGLHWTTRGLRDEQLTTDAIQFVLKLMAFPIKHTAMENPPGKIGTLIRKADQYIHPHQFGHSEAKKTGLWLKNLPKLQPTNVLKPPRMLFGLPIWDNQTESGNNKIGEQVWRQDMRSETYQGIADAMATQWTAHFIKTQTT